MQEVTGEKFDASKMFEALMDGEIMIRLVNTIKPGTIPKWNVIDPKQPKAIALAATGNIRLYLAAVQALGVPGVDMFLVEDLRTGRSMTMVCRNLASFSRIAARDLGWEGPTLGPRLSRPGPKKWEDIEYNPYQNQDDFASQDEMEEMLSMYKGLLEKEHSELVKVLSSEGVLKHEVEKLRGQIKQFKRDHEVLVDELEQQQHQQLRGSARGADPAAHKRVEGMKQALQRNFSDPGVPEHLQPVEKSDQEDIEKKNARRMRKLASEKDVHAQSSETVAEWQKKANKVQKKMKMKQERRMSFSDHIDSPNGSFIEEDFENEESNDVIVDLLPDHDFNGSRRRRRSSPSSPGGTPSKMRRDRSGQSTTHSVGRKALIVIIVVEALVICGLTAGTTYFALMQ